MTATIAGVDQERGFGIRPPISAPGEADTIKPMLHGDDATCIEVVDVAHCHAVTPGQHTVTAARPCRRRLTRYVGYDRVAGSEIYLSQHRRERAWPVPREPNSMSRTSVETVFDEVLLREFGNDDATASPQSQPTCSISSTSSSLRRGRQRPAQQALIAWSGTSVMGIPTLWRQPSTRPTGSRRAPAIGLSGRWPTLKTG